MPAAKIDYRGRLSKGLNSSRDLTKRDKGRGFMDQLMTSIPPNVPKDGPDPKIYDPGRAKKVKGGTNKPQPKRKVERSMKGLYTKQKVKQLIIKSFTDYKDVASKRGSKNFNVERWFSANL